MFQSIKTKWKLRKDHDGLGTYAPLPSDRHIRLLDVRVEADHTVTYSFRPISIERGTPLPNYTALSYCWGDARPVREIELESGGSLRLSRTLSDLFDSLLGRGSETGANVTLWIDALCINQKDTEEKVSQILLMKEVYSCATKVLLWLHGSTDGSKVAFQYMQTRAEVEDEDGKDERENDLYGLDAVFRLLARPWFQRVWVIQEVTLNNNVSVQCGNDVVDIGVLEDCVNRVWRFLDYDSADEAAMGLHCITRIFAIRNEYKEHGMVAYETLFELAAHCSVTDPRDKVYAFRGIADNSRPVPPPNYAISTEQLAARTTEALVCYGTCLDVLALCGMAGAGKRSKALPTWALDFHTIQWEEPLVVCDQAGWNAGGRYQIPEVVTSARGSGLLKLRVKPISVIERICPLFDSDDVAQQQAAVGAVLLLRPEHITEQAWMMGLVSTLIFGLNIEDEPSIEGYEDHFAEWLTWLKSRPSNSNLDGITRNPYHLTMKTRVSGWGAFMTKDEHLCVGSPLVERGDMLCVVPGCRLPLILRRDGAKEANERDLEKGTWALVGWCFAEGLMFGKGRDVKEEGGELLYDILLR